MKGLLGLINLYEDESGMGVLARQRPLAAMPYAGRYRLIDFALSNLVNAGVRTVGVLVRDKYRSLIDHLRSGKEWDLARKRDGLYILPPAATIGGPCNSDVDNFLFNLDYISAATEDFVIICGSRTICNLPIDQVFQYHLSVEADVTIISRDWPDDGAGPCLSLDEEGRVMGMCDFTESLPYDIQPLGFYIMSKSLMAQLVRECAAEGSCDFFTDGVLKNIDKLKVYAFRHVGYVARIDSVASYFQHQLELLNPAIWQELFFRYGIIFTKVKDEAPAKYRERACVTNSLVANGCIIEGTVENSILFRSVIVEKGAVVRNSIVIQNTRVGPNARLTNVLCDKDSQVTAGRCLSGSAAQPFIVEKGSVI
ncbi:MAG TPA: glucose-1-phosphate adenylyltransferase subunit GlgD [Negativicutes bacterium]|nr:glucose-1-phosphate adenylyltransferase subunit GlgD [Negativicutes bacterium]